MGIVGVTRTSINWLLKMVVVVNVTQSFIILRQVVLLSQHLVSEVHFCLIPTHILNSIFSNDLIFFAAFIVWILVTNVFWLDYSHSWMGDLESKIEIHIIITLLQSKKYKNYPFTLDDDRCMLSRRAIIATFWKRRFTLLEILSFLTIYMSSR